MNKLAGVTCAFILSLAVGGCADMAGVGACADDDVGEICGVFRIVNEERSNAGLFPYELNAELSLAGQRHAEDMVAQGYFDHVSLDGRSFADRALEAGYDASPRGENIAAGQRSPEQVMTAWMDSSGHRANILSDGSNEIGIGFFENNWVQVFGRRTMPVDR